MPPYRPMAATFGVRAVLCLAAALCLHPRAAIALEWKAATATLSDPALIGGFRSRMRHTATALDGKVYVWGGESDGGFTRTDSGLVADPRDLYEFDLATGTWTRIAPGTPRAPGGSAANFPASHYYNDDGRPRVRRAAHSCVVMYHPKQGQPINGRPFLIMYGGTNLEKDAAVITGAGQKGVQGVQSKDLTDVLMFDPQRGMDVQPDKTGPRWSVPDFVMAGSAGVIRPPERHGHAAAALERTAMVVFGGYSKERETEWCGSCPYLNDLWILSNDGGVKWKWTYVDNAGLEWPHLLHAYSKRPHERYGHSFDNFGDATSSAGNDHKTTMVVFGGKTYNYGDGIGRGNVEYRKDVWLLEVRYTGPHPVKTNAITEDNLNLFWRPRATLGDENLQPRAFHATAIDGLKMYVFGGYAVDHDDKRQPRFFNDVWELDLTAWQWTERTAAATNNGVGGAHMSARAHHSASLLPLPAGGKTVLLVAGITRVEASGSACGAACGLQDSLPEPKVQHDDHFSALERCAGTALTQKQLGVDSAQASQCVYQFDLA